MELSIQDSYGFTVYSSDEKKIGTLLNIMINNLSFEATLLVFPGLKSEFGYRKVGKVASTASGFGTRILQNLIPELYDVVDIASEVQSEVITEVSQRADQKAADIGASYYCIPSINAETLQGERIILNLDAEECESWYKNTPVSAETEYVFFDATAYKGPYRSVPISLNLPTIKGLLVYDPAGRNARVTDLKFDPTTGNLKSLEMKYKGTTKSIEKDYLKKEYSSFTSTIEFQEEESKGSQSPLGISEMQQIYLNSTKTDIARAILINLNRPKTVEEIATELRCQDCSVVVPDIDELENQGSIVCLTPDREEYRQYYLTDAGIRVKNVLLGQELFENL